MATSGTQGLQRKSLSSKRAQRTIEAIETHIGVRVSGDGSDNTPSETLPSGEQLEFDFTRGVDKTN